ncbi:MAG: hypothetical protein A2Y21_03690 [Clostridiales bacterium GWC2_40_7]|nr:MAG: hypothetical protein A2Y21_03690 [Clostridiales bacterium GWC2_40_7]
MDNFSKINMIDCHLHTYDINCIDKIGKEMKTCNLDAINILSLTSYGEEYMAQNPMCLLFKAMYPEKIYCYGSLHYPLNGTLKEQSDFREQAERLMKLGFDGIKMIEGKPDARKRINEPLDSTTYDKYFAFLEDERIPILYHVADPASFWDKDKVPDFAIKEGWFYGDGTYVSKETLYEEVDRILSKFPMLRVIFAHFYFMSEDLERAAKFLDKWPEASFDITPGSEMYEDFSKAPDKWHGFFTKYQDRILLGTDNICGDIFNSVNILRTFLETNGKFQSFGMDLCGIHLDKEVLEKIYYKNFQRYSGTSPKKINYKLAIDECNNVIEKCKNSPMSNKILLQMHQILEKMYVFKEIDG